MRPRIQYARTADGVSIAFWTLGEGMPYVQMPTFGPSHIQLEWQWPESRTWYERLADGRKLVRFDSRGSGLSERDVSDLSLRACLMDLEAVVERLRLERFALSAGGGLGPVAIAYAARHPERVSHLVLWCSWARGADYFRSPEVQAVVSLRDRNWEIYTETVAHALAGWSEGEQARRMAALVRESVTQEWIEAFVRAAGQFDATDLLPQVRSPTLVLHRRQLTFMDVSLARRLSAAIPDARLALLEGESIVPFLGDMESVAQAIDEFLGEGEEAPAPAVAKEGVHTILFTDIESSTTITQRLGDAKAQGLVRTHNTIVRDALKAHGGSEVKHTGDGIMASFPSASQALQCAIAIQQAVAAQADMPFRVRIGLNAGEPVAEEQDLFGTAVQLARRVCDHAEPGQILVSDVVRQLAMGKGFLFSDQGDVELRGFEDPARLYEVRWQD